MKDYNSQIAVCYDVTAVQHRIKNHKMCCKHELSEYTFKKTYFQKILNENSMIDAKPTKLLSFFKCCLSVAVVIAENDLQPVSRGEAYCKS